jgi:AraC-like DNA-binding protein
VRFIHSASLATYAETARAVGLDAQRMLAAFDLPLAALRQPDLPVPVDAVIALLEASARRSGAEAFGLLMAERRRLSHLGLLGLLIREQPTLHAALGVLRDHAWQVTEALAFAVESSGEVVLVREELIVGRAAPIRQLTEFVIGACVKGLCDYLGADWRPLRVAFTHDAPVDRVVHVRVLGHHIDFEQRFNGVVLSQRNLDAANPNADPVFESLARSLLHAASAAHAHRVIDDVRALVALHLPTGGCSVAQVAGHLGVDRRSIHRRLAQEGTTYASIVDAVRCELAARFVADCDRPLAEVAEQLGFAAPSGFSRWYRRRFGAAPSIRRRDATAEPAGRRKRSSRPGPH